MLLHQDAPQGQPRDQALAHQHRDISRAKLSGPRMIDPKTAVPVVHFVAIAGRLRVCIDRGGHPMGESKRGRLQEEEMLMSCAGVRTASGRVQVRWEADSAATTMGQLAYFIEFLTLTGLWLGWQEGCPLSYTSPNAPSKVDVLGTWMLSILSGHRRYSHVTTIRCDGVNPPLLGMNKVISEDAAPSGAVGDSRRLGRGLARQPPARQCSALA